MFVLNLQLPIYILGKISCIDWKQDVNTTLSYHILSKLVCTLLDSSSSHRCSIMYLLSCLWPNQIITVHSQF